MSDQLLNCPRCSQQVACSSSLAGQIVACPYCSQQMQVPPAHVDPMAPVTFASEHAFDQHTSESAPAETAEQGPSHLNSPQITETSERDRKRKKTSPISLSCPACEREYQFTADQRGGSFRCKCGNQCYVEETHYRQGFELRENERVLSLAEVKRSPVGTPVSPVSLFTATELLRVTDQRLIFYTRGEGALTFGGCFWVAGGLVAATATFGFWTLNQSSIAWQICLGLLFCWSLTWLFVQGRRTKKYGFFLGILEEQWRKWSGEVELATVNSISLESAPRNQRAVLIGCNDGSAHMFAMKQARCESVLPIILEATEKRLGVALTAQGDTRWISKSPDASAQKLQIRCERCRKALLVPSDSVGKSIICPKCGSTFNVPAA